MDWLIIGDIVILLAAALVGGLLFEVLKQSFIVGCLVAGMLIGPTGLGWVHGEQLSVTAELGVTLLMFTIGLEVTWKQFAGFGAAVVGGGIAQILITIAGVAVIAHWMEMSWAASITLGAIVSLSSTSTVLRVFHERAEMDSMHGRLALGILLLQDAAVIPLVLLVTFLSTESGWANFLAAMGQTTGKAAGLAAVLVLVGTLVLPRLFHFTALRRNRELPVILAVVTWLTATWAAHSMGLSAALGAFVAGLALAESPFAGQIRSDVAPFRVAFVTLFFASLGLLADLHWLIQPANLLAVAMLVLAIGIGKSIVVWVVLRFFGRANRECLAAGIALGQIGEFSFVLAAIASGHALFDEDMFQLVVTATLLTLVLTPLMATRSLEIAGAVERLMVQLRIWRAPGFQAVSGSERFKDHALVVGFGPAGKRVVAALRSAGLEAVVVDLNPRTVAASKAQGVRAVIGDASQRETLDHLGIGSARVCVVTVPTHGVSVRVIEQVRFAAPHVPIVARARYHNFARFIGDSGADVLVDEEQSVGELLGTEAIKAATGRTGARVQSVIPPDRPA